jgi:hypothetical protein
MKNMKNLLLSTLLLISSTSWLEAWRCSGCPGEKGNNEQAISLCQRGHQYCAPCAAHNANQCTQCIRQNPQGDNIGIAVDSALQNSPRCHNCRELFNDTDHFMINPNPCHHRICVSCAHTLLQNRGYSQRSANYTNRHNAPRYDEGFVNHVQFDRHGRQRFEHRHRNVLGDNVINEHSQQQHYIAAQCPVPTCNRAFSEATCRQVDMEYNNRAISFGRYMLNRLGRNKNEQIVKGVVLGGVAAVYAWVLYKAYQENKKAKERQITENPKPTRQQKRQHQRRHAHHNQKKSNHRHVKIHF